MNTARNAAAGASDCASCCGVLLELARTIIADASVPIPAPLVLLLNGAEETFLQVGRPSLVVRRAFPMRPVILALTSHSSRYALPFSFSCHTAAECTHRCSYTSLT